ncbi:alkaline phosphatase [Bacterioplanoides sp. SCSIO 12839]|uniref:alkaline phosphatase n=1 Tax=Bacterioplanoides sp. SCSIO 12839 TaxID=2829569 RepID=UPI0021046E96|nr:alkaline phosphatase [Bacterioplanoides sp. SCSIO 12839]UTW47816.1 alkaline phosphatase [Bacterioplanoides sp. SCSIO 12839]
MNALHGTFLSTLLLSAMTNAAQPDFEQGQQWLKQRLEQRQQQNQQQAQKQSPETARNLILFLGDGMSVTTLTAARIFEGQQRGEPGEENQLYFENFPYSALVKTYNTNQQTADSAGTMSAITTGVKTRAGVIAIGPEQDRAICAGSQQYHQQTLLQWASQQGYATGIVTSARITHATPAAAYAHSPERDWEADSDLTAEAQQHGCKDIAWQLINKAYDKDGGLDIMLGGGKTNFTQASWYTRLFTQYLSVPFYVLPDFLKSGGKRYDADLIQQWQQQFPNGHYLENHQQLTQFSQSAQQAGPVLGLFANSHLPYQYDSQKSGNESQYPPLQQMTQAAQTYLQRRVKQDNLKGYLLIVEGARIDHAHHLGNAYRALDETVAMAESVKIADQLSGNQTLIIVTADHSHTLSMAGYPQRGNAILGFVDNNGQTLALDNHPYTTLGYANGFGAHPMHEDDHTQRKPGRVLWKDAKEVPANPEDADFYQAALAGSYYETHGSDDVALHAKGPGAQYFHGLIDQHEIYHRIRRALHPAFSKQQEH